MPSHDYKTPTFEFYIKYERPEEQCRDPLQFYNDQTIKEYANSKALMAIQERIIKRALNITEVDPPARVLDLGMGCGFATTYLYLKHYSPVGIDISRPFLTYYPIPEFNPIEADLRLFGFRPQSFDLIVSISAIQWILAEISEKKRRTTLDQLAKSCGEALKPTGKLIFQFFPKSDTAMHEVGASFKRTRQFEGGFIIDNPENPKKRRIFISLKKLE